MIYPSYFVFFEEKKCEDVAKDMLHFAIYVFYKGIVLHLSEVTLLSNKHQMVGAIAILDEHLTSALFT